MLTSARGLWRPSGDILVPETLADRGEQLLKPHLAAGDVLALAAQELDPAFWAAPAQLFREQGRDALHGGHCGHRR